MPCVWLCDGRVAGSFGVSLWAAAEVSSQPTRNRQSKWRFGVSPTCVPTKSELVWRTVFYTRQETDQAIGRYIDGSGAIPPSIAQAWLSSKNQPPSEPMPLHQSGASPIALVRRQRLIRMRTEKSLRVA